MTGAALLALSATLLAGAAAAQALTPADRGRALFERGDTLQGTMEEYRDPLPALAIRCANCHSDGIDAAGRRAIGGVLTAETMTGSRRRRAGPPSTYSAESLCRLLRTGVDPAGIYVSGSMPRYRVTDDQCRDLFAHLERRT